ncbi:MAG: F(420)H(2) dehydrogenase subunit J [Methanosaeta sp. PtaB.Bin039]|nr:MAG: F(420)H(2) dehydrogenase subunit J [Methanosaeta sp. PtaB.Bin039]OPY45219.1 MAG: F(420)H(2) dehydrogenase subunit J [Methanosaeta sp. PtaU1.Bin028]HQF16613.1 NADH-quinone oxidoreductase subunit J [Methanotrichaceae archaeon]HQI91245.1 NADH-quinone oxidoreductase subunit J [Methanotrichaceae archaeon]HQJ61707.1 NADH-quinone oxidoreductase subunit J [Methanothrix soehngenii]
MTKFKTAILAIIFLAVLLASISLTPWNYGEQAQPAYEPVKEGMRTPESGIGSIGVELFTIYMFPFEVLSLVLLAALIGAIYIAKKETA